jgi:NAD(P)-dependent dehydrogenase (short-subunit alcohol dehydrogenase family)
MQHLYKLTDKVALITGGSEGIGLGTARVFINLGAKVILTGRTLETFKKGKKRTWRELHHIPKRCNR